MNIFIMLAIVVANLIAILLIYQFIKKLPKIEKIIFIAISFAIIYVLVSIIYWISGFGIDSRINEAAKDFITFTFVPVNVIILIPFVAAKYNKLRFKEIEKSEFIKRLIVVGIVGIVILTMECVYFKDMKNNIEILNSDVLENNGEANSTNEENTQNIVTSTNEIYTNEIGVNLTNVEVVNETTNTVSVNEENNTLNQNELE